MKYTSLKEKVVGSWKSAVEVAAEAGVADGDDER